MANNKFPDISVGDFASDILKSMATSPDATKPALSRATLESANVPDLKGVEVSQDFVDILLEGKRKPQTKKVVKPQKIAESTETRISKLVEQLASLVNEAKTLVEELSAGATTTGNIGVNMASKTLKKPCKKTSCLDRIKRRMK